MNLQDKIEAASDAPSPELLSATELRQLRVTLNTAALLASGGVGFKDLRDLVSMAAAAADIQAEFDAPIPVTKPYLHVYQERVQSSPGAVNVMPPPIVPEPDGFTPPGIDTGIVDSDDTFDDTIVPAESIVS